MTKYPALSLSLSLFLTLRGSFKKDVLFYVENIFVIPFGLDFVLCFTCFMWRAMCTSISYEITLILKGNDGFSIIRLNAVRRLSTREKKFICFYYEIQRSRLFIAMRKKNVCFPHSASSSHILCR